MTTPPRGFQIIEHKPEELLVLDYHANDMRGVLLIFFVAVLLLGGGFLIGFAVAPKELMAMFTDTWWSALAGVCGLLALTHFFFLFLSHLLRDVRMTATQDALVITRTLLFLTWSTNVSRLSMKSLEQIQDGDEGRDPFPSWGLILRSPSRHTLLKGQPMEKSDWLGVTLSEWFGVPFKPANKRG